MFSLLVSRCARQRRRVHNAHVSRILERQQLPHIEWLCPECWSNILSGTCALNVMCKMAENFQGRQAEDDCKTTILTRYDIRSLTRYQECQSGQEMDGTKFHTKKQRSQVDQCSVSTADGWLN